MAVQELCSVHGLRAADLDRLEYHAPPLIHRLVGRLAKAGMEPGYARLCMQYLAAVTLLRGTVTLGDFSSEALDDPAVLALAEKIAVIADDNPDLAAFVPARAVAHLQDGRVLTLDVSAQFGSPQWPLSEAQHMAKALGCLEFAGLGAVHAPLVAAIAALPASSDAVATLIGSGVLS
jgi:2-methylcitrate dehydratase PrpD